MPLVKLERVGLRERWELLASPDPKGPRVNLDRKEHLAPWDLLELLDN